MITRSGSPGETAQRIAPLRLVAAAAIALLGAGAVYLYAVRGEAILLDLAAAAGRMFCF